MLSTTLSANPCLIASVCPTDKDTVEYSRLWLTMNKNRGVDCPTCARHIEEYTMSISHNQADALKKIYEKYRHGFFNLQRVRNSLHVDKNKELTRLAHSNLIRSIPGEQGSWSITHDGGRWLRGEISVPRTIQTYQGKLTAQSIETVTFQDVYKVGLVSDRDPIDYGDDDSLGKSSLKGRGKSRNTLIRDNDEDLFSEIGDIIQRFSWQQSIEVARKIVAQALVEEDHDQYCPTCDRIVAYNYTTMTDAKANLLIHIYRHYGMSPVHVPTFEFTHSELSDDGHASESAHRGLLAIDTTKPGKERSGWYKLTKEGVDWIFGKSYTKEKLQSFNRSFTPCGKDISVTEIFNRGTKWDYIKLMEGLVPPLTEDDLFEN